jgi:hypothetical protein
VEEVCWGLWKLELSSSKAAANSKTATTTEAAAAASAVPGGHREEKKQETPKAKQKTEFPLTGIIITSILCVFFLFSKFFLMVFFQKMKNPRKFCDFLRDFL